MKSMRGSFSVLVKQRAVLWLSSALRCVSSSSGSSKVPTKSEEGLVPRYTVPPLLFILRELLRLKVQESHDFT